MRREIEKDQIFLSGLCDRIKFHYLRGKGHLPFYLWNRFQWYNYPKWHKISRYPLHLDIETSSICNMECPMCYTRMDLYKERVESGLMDFGLFRKIIDESIRYGLFSIRLSLRGEAFLNPYLIEMLQYAKSQGIKEVSTLTNGFKLSKEIFERLIDNGLDWLIISIDGWGDTYESIRKPAKFDDIYQKVKDFALIKKKKKSQKPVIKVQSIWPAIQEDPAYFYSLFKPYVDEIASNPLIDFLREDKQIRYIENFTCVYIWQRMSIGANGDILMCQCDEIEENILGNANKDSIYDIWHGDKLNLIRKIHIEGKGTLLLEPCKHCTYPRKKEFYGEASVENRRIKIEKYTGRSESIQINKGGNR